MAAVPNSKRQLAVTPSTLRRRSTHEEVVFLSDSDAPRTTEVIGRSIKNTHYLLGVSQPYHQITHIVHRDGKREVKDQVPGQQVYKLSHVEQGVVIPKSVKYQRILPKLDALKPNVMIEEQLGKVMGGDNVRNKRLTGSSPDGKKRRRMLGE